MKATIDTITVTVGEQTLTFTLAEAEALRAVLNDKLGQPQKVIVKEVERREPPVFVPREIWRAPESTPYRPWEVTCRAEPSSTC